MKTVFDPAFCRYGRVVRGYDATALVGELEKTPLPDRGVEYVASHGAFEALEIAKELERGVYGGMPIQLGYCNGSNSALNCLEYHRGSELNVPASDMVLLVADSRDIRDGSIDSGAAEAFVCPKGTVALLYETALHYAPCNGKGQEGFKVVIVLPRGTNTKKPDIAEKNHEDKLLWGRNKWLLAHPDTDEARQGAYVGITGRNVSTEDFV